MRFWETAPDDHDSPQYFNDYAHIWRSAEKIVYSSTLDAPTSERTRIESAFDPHAVRQLKASAERDISIGGAELAAHALKARLIDECHVFVSPVIVGGGKRFLPGELHLELDLLGERRFGNGVVHLHYAIGA